MKKLLVVLMSVMLIVTMCFGMIACGPDAGTSSSTPTSSQKQSGGGTSSTTKPTRYALAIQSDTVTFGDGQATKMLSVGSSIKDALSTAISSNSNEIVIGWKDTNGNDINLDTFKMPEAAVVVIPVLQSHTHSLTYVPAQPCTATNHSGSVGYYTCECGKKFADETATKEITDTALYGNGIGQDYFDMASWLDFSTKTNNNGVATAIPTVDETDGAIVIDSSARFQTFYTKGSKHAADKSSNSSTYYGEIYKYEWEFTAKDEFTLSPFNGTNTNSRVDIKSFAGGYFIEATKDGVYAYAGASSHYLVAFSEQKFAFDGKTKNKFTMYAYRADKNNLHVRYYLNGEQIVFTEYQKTGTYCYVNSNGDISYSPTAEMGFGQRFGFDIGIGSDHTTVQEEPTQEGPTQEGPTQEGPTQEGPTQEEPTVEANQIRIYSFYWERVYASEFDLNLEGALFADGTATMKVAAGTALSTVLGKVVSADANKKIIGWNLGGETVETAHMVMGDKAITVSPVEEDCAHTNVKFVDASAATTRNNIGSVDHYTCSDCGHNFVDEACTQVLTDAGMYGNALKSDIFNVANWQTSDLRDDGAYTGGYATALPVKADDGSVEITSATRFDFFHSMLNVNGTTTKGVHIADTVKNVTASTVVGTVYGSMYKYEVKFSATGNFTMSLFNSSKASPTAEKNTGASFYLDFTAEGTTFNNLAGTTYQNHTATVATAAKLDGTSNTFTLYAIRKSDNVLVLSFYLNGVQLAFEGTSDVGEFNQFGDYSTKVQPAYGQRIGFVPRTDGVKINFTSAYWNRYVVSYVLSIAGDNGVTFEGGLTDAKLEEGSSIKSVLAKAVIPTDKYLVKWTDASDADIDLDTFTMSENYTVKAVLADKVDLTVTGDNGVTFEGGVTTLKVVPGTALKGILNNAVAPTGYAITGWTYGDDSALDINTAVMGETATSVKATLEEVHVHTMTYVEAVAHTATNAGTLGYYKCTSCEHLYSDAAGENEVTLEQLAMNGNAMGESFFDTTKWQTFSKPSTLGTLPTLEDNALVIADKTRFNFFYVYKSGTTGYHLADANTEAKTPAAIRGVVYKHEIEFTANGAFTLSLFNAASATSTVAEAGTKPSLYLDFTADGTTFTAYKDASNVLAATTDANAKLNFDGTTKNTLTVYVLREDLNTLKVMIYINGTKLALTSEATATFGTFENGYYKATEAPGAGQRIGFAPAAGTTIKVYSALWTSTEKFGKESN